MTMAEMMANKDKATPCKDCAEVATKQTTDAVWVCAGCYEKLLRRGNENFDYAWNHSARMNAAEEESQ